MLSLGVLAMIWAKVNDTQTHYAKQGSYRTRLLALVSIFLAGMIVWFLMQHPLLASACIYAAFLIGACTLGVSDKTS